MSKTPIRAALEHLQAEGFVSIAPARGLRCHGVCCASVYPPVLSQVVGKVHRVPQEISNPQLLSISPLRTGGCLGI
jgi:hypothetical protein